MLSHLSSQDVNTAASRSLNAGYSGNLNRLTSCGLKMWSSKRLSAWSSTVSNRRFKLGLSFCISTQTRPALRLGANAEFELDPALASAPAARYTVVEAGRTVARQREESPSTIGQGTR